MASYYVDFNKSSAGDGTWANAYGMPDVYTNSTPTFCVACNTAVAGDELRLVGRDYFTHSFATNTVFWSTASNLTINLPTALSGNNNLFWFKDIRPELGSGMWWQEPNGPAGTSNTARVATTWGGNPLHGAFQLYQSFANATHSYINSVVQVVQLNTSTLVPLQHNGTQYGGALGSSMYLFRGLKNTMTITDNWTNDGVRDTTLNSNNKTIFMTANVSPTGQSYQILRIGDLASGAVPDGITLDLRNTVFASMATATANSSPPGLSIGYRFNQTSAASSNANTGMSIDVGAFVGPNCYPSNIQTLGWTNVNWAANATSSPSVRVRSLQAEGGYIYYVHGISQTFSTISPTNKVVEFAFDVISSQALQSAATSGTISKTSTANSTLRITYGDLLISGMTGASESGLGNYKNRPGYTFQTTSTTANTVTFLLDRSRIGAHNAGATAALQIPFGIQVDSPYVPYVLNYNSCAVVANGTITLANNVVWGGDLLGVGTTSTPSISTTTTSAPATTLRDDITTNHNFYWDGRPTEYAKVAYKLTKPFIDAVSITDFLTSYDRPRWAYTVSQRYEHLPATPSNTHPFGHLSSSIGPSVARPIVVDVDDNNGGAQVEYIPGMRVSGTGVGAVGFMPVTACTDVVSTGYSLKFNASKLNQGRTSGSTANPASFVIASAARYVKEIDIPTLSNLAAKSISLSIKQDTNTSIANVTAYFYTTNTTANVVTSTWWYAYTAGNTIANSAITTSYATWNAGGWTPTSTTGNRLILEFYSLGNRAGNGAIYIDNIQVNG